MDSTSAKAAFSARIASAVAAFGGEDEEPRLFLLGKDLSLLGFDRRGLVWKREDGLSLAVAAVVASLDAADSPKTEVGAATGGGEKARCLFLFRSFFESSRSLRREEASRHSRRFLPESGSPSAQSHPPRKGRRPLLRSWRRW